MNSIVKSGGLLFYFFIALFLSSVVMIILNLKEQNWISGNVVSTPSNVSILNYFAISISNNLSNGISFGNTGSNYINDLNATSNYDAQGGNQTSYTANVSADSNTPVEFCLSANAPLSSGNNIIGLGNESWANSSINNIILPSLENQVSFALSGIKASAPVAVGSETFWRFWLDIPAGVTAGSYNNSIRIEAVATSLSCP